MVSSSPQERISGTSSVVVPAARLTCDNGRFFEERMPESFSKLGAGVHQLILGTANPRKQRSSRSIFIGIEAALDVTAHWRMACAALRNSSSSVMLVTGSRIVRVVGRSRAKTWTAFSTSSHL